MEPVSPGTDRYVAYLTQRISAQQLSTARRNGIRKAAQRQKWRTNSQVTASIRATREAWGLEKGVADKFVSVVFVSNDIET